MRTRRFVPSKPNKTTVKEWVWKEGQGLFVEYESIVGQHKSGWALKELLEADHTSGDGLPAAEVFSGNPQEFGGEDYDPPNPEALERGFLARRGL